MLFIFIEISILIFMLDSSIVLISWKSKKQVIISHSWCRYWDLASTTCDNNLQHSYPVHVPIHCDKNSAIQIAHNPIAAHKTY